MSISVNYVITAVVAAGTEGVNVAYTLSESTSALSESHNDYMPIAGIDQGVTAVMTAQQRQTQQLANFLTLIAPTSSAFAQKVENALDQVDLQTNLNAGSGVITASSLTMMALNGAQGAVDVPTIRDLINQHLHVGANNPSQIIMEEGFPPSIFIDFLQGVMNGDFS